MSVNFATFCYNGDIHRLHYPGHFNKLVSSNLCYFSKVIVVYQNCKPKDHLYSPYALEEVYIKDMDKILTSFNIKLDKPQYKSPTDNHHNWKNHVVNHLAAIEVSNGTYTVFADNDCWVIKQPYSWVLKAIEILETNSDVLIVSPNDGEPERKAQTISQQMFICRTEEFKRIDFNQPGWDGNVTKCPEMPEYHGMLEGRIHHYCRYTNKYRYVLSPEYRYWHFNRIDPETNYFITDLGKY